MQALVDAIVYGHQACGGVSRIFNALLPRMCQQDGELVVTLLSCGRLRQALPTGERILHKRLFPVDDLLRPGRLWGCLRQHSRARLQRWALGQSGNRIWHSTFFTALRDWREYSVVTVYDMIPERYPHMFPERWARALSKRKLECLQRADAVVCISEATRAEVLEICGLPETRVRTVSLGCPEGFARLPDRPSGRRPFLLYVGSRARYKNFALLARAMSSWSRTREIDLKVVGPPGQGSERRELRRLGLEERVRWVGRVGDEELCRLYNDAVALVYPSLGEGFGLPLLEAMACGCPIVASRIPSTVEVAQDCPYYFDPTELESLREALDAALAGSGRAARLARGVERVRRFSWDATAAGTLGIYRELLGQSH